MAGPTTAISRRALALSLLGGVAVASSGAARAKKETPMAKDNPDPATIPDFDKWQLSDKEWKERLPQEAYAVLRKEATERPGSSPLDNEKREGVFACAGCGFELFQSGQKFDSGTGWPSFFDYIPGALGIKRDFKLIIPRTEYHCARCGGHQGHVFKDGPAPTGLRYCNNGVALTFKAA